MEQKRTFSALLSYLFPLYFIRKNNLSRDQVLSVWEGCIKEEQKSALVVSVFAVLAMTFYLIVAFIKHYFSLFRYPYVYLSWGILLLLVFSLLFIAFSFFTWHRLVSPKYKVIALFLFELSLLATSLLFIVSMTKLHGNENATFSLGYLWVLGLAFTAPSDLFLWGLISFLDILGSSLCFVLLPVPLATLPNYIVILVITLLGMWLIRSHVFTYCYYQKKTEWESSQNALLSITDCLTGIENRQGAKSYFAIKTPGWIFRNTDVTFILFDIDLFKTYNDKFGHLVGDECLKKVSQAVKSAVPENGTEFFRFGGDEFFLVVENEDQDVIHGIVLEIMRAIKDCKIPSSVKGKYLTVSIGVKTEKTGSGYDYEKHFQDADVLLYKAKVTHDGTACLNGEMIPPID
jgi:diguanylate cyclase (GGDEF)-like protein